MSLLPELRADYDLRVQELPDSNPEKAALVTFLSQPRPIDPEATNILYAHLSRPQERPKTVRKLLQLAAFEGKAVCVIENISPAHAKELGAAWDVDPLFFARHIYEPPREKLRTYKQWSSPNSYFENLNGVIQYTGVESLPETHSGLSLNYCERHVFKGDSWPWRPWYHASTCISYYRVRDDRYLILVDAPLIKYQNLLREPRPALSFRYAWNRGGILIPALFNKKSYSTMDLLESVFLHTWHIQFRCRTKETIANVPFLYMLSSSLWKTNLDFLGEEIKRISFEDVRRPSVAVTDALHTRREDLEALVKGVEQTIAYAAERTDKYFTERRYLERRENRAKIMHPLQQHHELLRGAARLDKFLMDTFQLVMSTMSVQDSQASVQLTRLAFIYAPLTFVTGIFGMNIREINDGHPKFWWCVVVLAISAVLTALAFWIISQPAFSVKEKAPVVSPRQAAMSATSVYTLNERLVDVENADHDQRYF